MKQGFEELYMQLLIKGNILSLKLSRLKIYRLKHTWLRPSRLRLHGLWLSRLCWAKAHGLWLFKLTFYGSEARGRGFNEFIYSCEL